MDLLGFCHRVNVDSSILAHTCHRKRSVVVGRGQKGHTIDCIQMGILDGDLVERLGAVPHIDVGVEGTADQKQATGGPRQAGDAARMEHPRLDHGLSCRGIVQKDLAHTIAHGHQGFGRVASNRRGMALVVAEFHLGLCQSPILATTIHPDFVILKKEKAGGSDCLSMYTVHLLHCCQQRLDPNLGEPLQKD